MRNAFIDELVCLAEGNSRIVLIVGDLGYSVVEPFAEKFPDRFFNAGVAEQNMTGMAAGMASEGYHVFTYSIANFPTFRCAEQVRNDIDYHQLPVTVVSVGGGLAYGALGYSHHAVQDYALIRSMPNMLIASPGDPAEVRACLRYLVSNPQPSYLRLGKSGEPAFHSEVPKLEPGCWNPIHFFKGAKKVLLTTGATLEIGMKIQESQPEKELAIFSLPIWGMPFKGKQSEQVKRFQNITTIEDHLIDGGFGSWLLESLSDNLQLRNRIRIRGLHPSVCGTVGAQKTLNSLGGISEEMFVEDQ